TKPSHAHAAATDQDRFGKIFRRNMPFGTVTAHGTMFVGFSADQRRLSRMVESMAGLAGGPRYAVRRYPRPVSGGLLLCTLHRGSAPDLYLGISTAARGVCAGPRRTSPV